jgi:site-specific DNA-cytosine methylase
MKNKNLKVIAICGGNGVICHPFKKNLVANIEPRPIFKTPMNIQWTLNFGEIPLFNKLEAFIKEFSTKPEVDLVVGAPDCGHSSILSYSRSKSLHNPRDNSSLTLFLQATKMFGPKVFIMENLPAMLKSISRSELREYFGDYRLKFIEQPVTFWGNSQKTRIRLLIIGVKRGSGYSLKDLIGGIEDFTPKTAGELLEGLVYGENGHFREDIKTRITLYAGKKMSLEDIRDEWLRRGVSRWEVTDRRFFTAPGVYLNLKDRHPATARKANRQFNHEGLTMSPRELARIQGVPDTFHIWMDESRIGYCINKGRTTVTKTPPYEIGQWIAKKLDMD